MAKPSSRADLAEYCLRALGKPVIEINIDNDQIEDRIDEALQFYQEYHSDAVIHTFHKHLLTETDITNEYITVPEELIFVTGLLPFGKTINSTNMFSIEYQMHLNDIFDLRQVNSIVNYEMTRQHMELIDKQLSGHPRVTFNRHRNRLYIDARWGIDILAGTYLIIEGYNAIKPKDFTDIYNDLFLKKYLTALFKRQWGLNLSKFEGIQMPGGVTLNGTKILDDANQEIEKLEQDVIEKYSKPIDFFVG